MANTKPITIRAPEADEAPPPSVPQEFRRFGLPDLEELGLWLVGRLKERYGAIDDRNAIGWLRGAMETNEFMFIRTGDCVGLAQISRRPLDPIPFVEEVFVLCRREEDEDKALGLYDRFATWAKQLGSVEMLVGNFSDVHKEKVAKHFGRVAARQIHVVRVRD